VFCWRNYLLVEFLRRNADVSAVGQGYLMQIGLYKDLGLTFRHLEDLLRLPVYLEYCIGCNALRIAFDHEDNMPAFMIKT